MQGTGREGVPDEHGAFHGILIHHDEIPSETHHLLVTEYGTVIIILVLVCKEFIDIHLVFVEGMYGDFAGKENVTLAEAKRRISGADFKKKDFVFALPALSNRYLRFQYCLLSIVLLHQFCQVHSGNLLLLPLFFQHLSQVPALSDDSFAGNLTGIAIKYKLIGMHR